jgi:hypothetical protein
VYGDLIILAEAKVNEQAWCVTQILDRHSFPKREQHTNV